MTGQGCLVNHHEQVLAFCKELTLDGSQFLLEFDVLFDHIGVSIDTNVTMTLEGVCFGLVTVHICTGVIVAGGPLFFRNSADGLIFGSFQALGGLIGGAVAFTVAGGVGFLLPRSLPLQRYR